MQQEQISQKPSEEIKAEKEGIEEKLERDLEAANSSVSPVLHNSIREPLIERDENEEVKEESK